MKRFIYGKTALILIAALLLAFFDLPAATQKKIIPWTPTWITNSKINLGLDLQGGTQLDYRIDLSQVDPKDQDNIVDGVKEVINKRVNGMGVSEPNIYISKYGEEKHIIVELAGIKDIEEAKKIVGKTIQLEFKEQKTEADPEEKNNVKKKADEILNTIKNGADFIKTGEEQKKANPGKIDFYQFENYYFADQLGAVGPKLVALNAGDVIKELIETNEEETSKIFPTHADPAFNIFKILDKKQEERELKHEREVQTSHILVSYDQAAKDNNIPGITRTEEEAKKRAEEALEKAKNGEDFAKLAKEYSDDEGSKNTDGKLDKPVKKAAGDYIKEFEDSAFALTKKGELSAVIKSKYGFHIIKADDVKEASTEKKTEPKIKYAVIFFSTRPDPWKNTELNGRSFKHADVQINQSTFAPYVSIEFNEEGARLFEELTGRNVDKPVAIFVGGEMISAPRVNEKISGGQAQITGNFTLEEAQNLARDLNTGAIPAPITLSGEFTIGASLGQDALAKSLKAGLWGILILALFIMLYYRVPGVVALLALSVYSFLLLFVIKGALSMPVALAISTLVFIIIVSKILKLHDSGWEKFISFLIACFVLLFLTYLLSNPIVLTLAGVAGIILSIGMAVDANILIFERIKEELRGGRSLNSAIDVGFDRAWNSIRDSNFSSLITCAILVYFGSSIIQGFAYNLAAGILISMFSAITITKTLLHTVSYTKLNRNLWLFGMPKNKEVKYHNILGYKNYFFTLSGILAVISIIIIVFIGLKFSLDFTGGSQLEIKLGKTDATITEIQTALTETTVTANEGEEKIDLTKAIVVPTQEKTFIIRTKTINDQTYQNIISKFKEKFTSAEIVKYMTIGPTIGNTLKQRAFIALFLSSIMIILYIAFAFRKIPRRLNPWGFGVCAVVALIHDILITFGVYVLLTKLVGIEIDAMLITALLTIMGFSVHDTIVVYDRIRENLKFQKKDESFETVANAAMIQTIARSINTSLTTFITISALFLWGADSIKWFAFTLMFGIIIGTYSSIFVASALVVAWKNWQSKQS